MIDLTNLAPPPDSELSAQFQPIFDEIAQGVLLREGDRILAHDAVTALRDARFTSLRIPRSLGGSGASLRQLFWLLIGLGEADPNLPQILRAHFAFVEGQRGARREGAETRDWLELVANGAVFGAAMAERGSATETTTTLTAQESGGWILDGVKYYSTGTLYASWIVAVARDGEDRLILAVPADAPGVTLDDDWDGFGQRLTGSGTTRFDGVRLTDAHILKRTPARQVPGDRFLIAFYQLVHLATLAGIARAIRRDAIAFVQAKTRTFGVPGQTSPRHDPLVQRVVGRLSAIAFAAEALVDRVARMLDELDIDGLHGELEPARYAEADIAAFEAQQIALPLVLEASTLLFEVGGASAVSRSLLLDRHWRNARVLASHNPAIQRERAIGDFRLNGTDPGAVWRDAFPDPPRPATEGKPDA